MSSAAATTELSALRRWLVFAALVPGILMAMVDATVMSIATPSIVWDLNTTITQVTWVMNAYNLGLCVLFLSMGRVADRFGHKLIYLLGLAIFAGFSLMCARAGTIIRLDLYRVGQAVGAAAIIPISLVILLSAFPRQKRGFAAGLYGATTSLAAALGPTIGGFIVEGKFQDWAYPKLQAMADWGIVGTLHLHDPLLRFADWFWMMQTWRWIYYLNVPVGALALVAALLLVPHRGRVSKDARIDLLGMALVAAGLFCLTLAIIQVNDWGWLSPAVLGLLVAAVALLSAYVWWELHYDSPMFDLRLFRIRAFAAANAAVITIDVAMMGTMFLLVIYMVGVQGFGETKAAWAVTPMPLAGLILAPISGRLVDRIGPRIIVVVGSIVSAVGLWMIGDLNISATVADTAWRTSLVGIGVGLSLPALMAAGMTALPRDRQGVGSGSLNTARQLGFVLGVAILTAVFTHQIGVRMDDAALAGRQVVDNGLPARLLSQETKDAIYKSLDEASKVQVSHGIDAIRILSNPAAGVAAPPAGTPAAYALDWTVTQIKIIYRAVMAEGFKWPFRTAAIFALLAVPPGLLLGRRLGEGAAPEEDDAAPQAEAPSS